ncbi:MAG TPA: hypothetical protein VNC41_19715, partial [Acidimicrobiia bacterium]|nr:hypothetical protein [Acidimicrobiia bacterium]
MKRVFVIGLALLALGACSSDGSDASPNSQPATTQPAAAISVACTLVGQADADTFFGGAAMQMQSSATGGESSACIWT